MLLFQCGRLAPLCVRCDIYCYSSVRYISRNSAIRQGLLAEKRNAAAPSIPSRVRRSTKSSYGKEDGVVRKRNSERKRVRPNGQYETGEWVVSTSRGSTLSDINATRSKSRTKESSRDKSQVRSSQMRSKQESPIKAEKQGRPPFSLPYTTAASEFLYGHSAVVAALKANRRQLYKLYIHRRASDKSVDSLDIERLSRSTNVRIVHVNDKWLPLLDKAAKDRPHNVRQPQPNKTTPKAATLTTTAGRHPRSVTAPQAPHPLPGARLALRRNNRGAALAATRRRRRHQRRPHHPAAGAARPHPNRAPRRLGPRPRQPGRHGAQRVLPGRGGARAVHAHLRAAVARCCQGERWRG